MAAAHLVATIEASVMCGTWSASRATPSKSAFRLALKQEAGPAAEAASGAGSEEAAAAAAAAPPPRCLTGVWDGEFMVGRAKVPERGVLLTFMKMDDDDSDDDDDDGGGGGGGGGVDAVARYVVTGQGANRYGSFTLSGEARTLAPLSKLATEEEAAEVGLSLTLAKQYVVAAAGAAGAAGAAAAAAGGGGRSKRKRTEVNYASLDLGSGVGLDGFAPREEARRLEGMLDSKDFALFDARFPVLEDGAGLDARSLLARHGGLREPVLVRRRAGLGMRLPVRGSMAVADVVDAVGAFEPVPVLEVASHLELRDWNLLRWGEYMATPARERSSTLNVISLEVSATSLAPRVVPPLLVRQLDWVETAWPAELHAAGDVPKVQKYCLMTAAGAWTDFHVDFGGSSVWYHLLTGEKRFYLIPPTAAHLGAYERWAKGDVGGQDVFLPDVLASEAWAAARAAAAAAGEEAAAPPPPSCYHLRLHPGETLLIPTGWIHAVFTPVDSLVFGGNFLHSLNVGGQLRLQSMEARMGVEERFRFPHFVRLQWFGAARVLKALRAVAARGGEAAVAAAAAGAAGARGGGKAGLNPLTASFAALGEDAMLVLDGGAAARDGAGALVRALRAWADGAQRAMEAAAAAEGEGGGAGGRGGSDGSDGSVRAIVQSAMWAARSVGYLGGAASVEAAVAAEAAAVAAAGGVEGAASKAPAALLGGPRRMLQELSARAAGQDETVSAPPPPPAAVAPAEVTATVTVPRAETVSSSSLPSSSSSSSSSAGAGGAASGAMAPGRSLSVKMSFAPPTRIPVKMGLSEHMEASAKAKAKAAAAAAALDAKPRPVIKIGGLGEPAVAVAGVLDDLFGEEDFEEVEELLEEEEAEEEEEEEEEEQARMPVPALKFKLGGGGAIAAVAAPKPPPAPASAPSLKMKFAGGAVVFAGAGAGGARGAAAGAAAGSVSLPLPLLPEGKGQGKFDAAGLEFYREARALHLSVTAANETKMPKSYARTAAVAAAAVEAAPDRRRRQSAAAAAAAAGGGPGEDDDGEPDYHAPAQKRQRAAASKPRARAAIAPKPAAKKKGPSLRERLKMRRR